jgi:hypothetical protein
MMHDSFGTTHSAVVAPAVPISVAKPTRAPADAKGTEIPAQTTRTPYERLSVTSFPSDGTSAAGAACGAGSCEREPMGFP